MVTIVNVGDAGGRPELGRECRFVVTGENVTAVTYFLEHEGVLYPDPLPSEADRSVRLYPEAPGHYTLHASWQSSEGSNGWTRAPFDVAGPNGAGPQQVVADGQKLWVPTPWDKRIIGEHERPVVRELRRIIARDWAVYDIGANVGLFSLLFARWIGPKGWLYAVEPNPVCICFLRANLEQLRTPNFTIIPIALAGDSGGCTFTLNYGSSLIGVGTGSTVANKPGHRIGVDGQSLDNLIATFHLRAPDFIKLDVEGAEAAAVSGMRGTLERHRPSLMIELHGREAAEATLPQLAPLPYRYLLCSTGATYTTADDLRRSLPDACVQIVATPL